MIKTINYFFQAIIVYLFFIIAFIVGIKISRIFFSFLFTLIGPFFKSKKIIEKNLEIYSKDISNSEKNQIILDMWKNYGATFIEYIFLKDYRKHDSHVAIKDNSNLLQLIKKNKPVIFVSGHFANFELMSMEITKKKLT